jgi:hypothetical protein
LIRVLSQSDCHSGINFHVFHNLELVVSASVAHVVDAQPSVPQGGTIDK